MTEPRCKGAGGTSAFYGGRTAAMNTASSCRLKCTGATADFPTLPKWHFILEFRKPSTVSTETSAFYF